MAIRSTASGRETPRRGALVEAEFTSREAARISGVPFFTLDYWDRSAFLKPSIARSTGRGRGHGRLYSYGDVLRLRIARELRNQHVSLQTLRFVVRRLADRARDLATAHYVVVGKTIRLAASFDELVRVLRSERRPFAFVLDLGDIQDAIAGRATRLRSASAATPTSRQAGS